MQQGENQVENPYRAPQASVFNKQKPSAGLDDVASGQKLIIYAILLYFLCAALKAVIGPLVLLPMLLCLGLSWTGIYKISRGLDYPMWARIVLLALMLIPLVGLLVLLALSSRATAKLKAAGYSVGLLGARDY
jgi:hypothetical protein